VGAARSGRHFVQSLPLWQETLGSTALCTRQTGAGPGRPQRSTQSLMRCAELAAPTECALCRSCRSSSSPPCRCSPPSALRALSAARPQRCAPSALPALSAARPQRCPPSVPSSNVPQRILGLSATGNPCVPRAPRPAQSWRGVWPHERRRAAARVSERSSAREHAWGRARRGTT
jgi:hypothetical protein